MSNPPITIDQLIKNEALATLQSAIYRDPISLLQRLPAREAIKCITTVAEKYPDENLYLLLHNHGDQWVELLEPLLADAYITKEKEDFFNKVCDLMRNP